MSAIWGVIDKKNNISDEIVMKMHTSMQNFKIDRFENIIRENIYFACGHQYLTEQAVYDVSPYFEKESKVWYTGDCFLYNREELIDMIASFDETLSYDKLSQMGDAILAYQCYRCFGEMFVKKLRGSFAFAIYDEKKGKILLYTDHTSQRYLSYYNDEKCFCFSTLYQPMLSYLGKENISLCDEWILAAYTDCSADTLRLPGKTVWKNIYQVEPGTYIKADVHTSEIEHHIYWNPLQLKDKKEKRSDEEYKVRFLSTFETVLKDMLRAKNETGIMLSGGLDSSAVGAFAAKKLATENKRLFSYTAVPVEGFKICNDAFYIEDETELIYAQKRMHPNIEPRFISVPDRNCFTNLKKYVYTFMEPVKPALNMINVEGMFLAAAEDNCSILLSGQNGNATISYGNLLSYVYQKSVSGHFLAAYKEIKAFGQLRRIGRKRIVSVYLKTLMDTKFRKSDFGKDCLIREEDIIKYNLRKLNWKIDKERGNGILDTKKQRRGFCFMPLVFQHMGFYNTYCSLKYGVLSLDPTLTKEVIELCLEMPIDCYVHQGKERRVVRDYMKGYIPEEILDNHTGRGIQAADFAYRVNRDWDNIKEDIFDILQEPLLRRYLDEDKLDALIAEVKEKEYNMDKNIVARTAVITSLGYFLRASAGKLEEVGE